MHMHMHILHMHNMHNMHMHNNMYMYNMYMHMYMLCMYMLCVWRLLLLLALWMRRARVRAVRPWPCGAGAFAMTWRFLNNTLQILALERAKGNRRLRKRCIEVLRAHDKNGDGMLDRSELQAMMAEISGHSWTDAQLESLEEQFTSKTGQRLRGEALHKVLAQVLTKQEAAHQALSEEGSIEWRLAFERISKCAD